MRRDENGLTLEDHEREMHAATLMEYKRNLPRLRIEEDDADGKAAAIFALVGLGSILTAFLVCNVLLGWNL